MIFIAAYSLPRQKQQKIEKTALYYLSANKSLYDQPQRFDALLIQRQADGHNRFDWIKNAFHAD